MKNVFLALILMIVAASTVWALPDQTQPIEIVTTGGTAQVIKTTSGTVYMISVNYGGVTAGDKVQIIDGANLTTGAGGTVRLTCIASSANGNCTVPLTVGAYFGTSIYYKETRTGGNFTTDVQYF